MTVQRNQVKNFILDELVGKEAASYTDTRIVNWCNIQGTYFDNIYRQFLNAHILLNIAITFPGIYQRGLQICDK